MISIKPGVSLQGLKPEMIVALLIAHSIITTHFGVDCVITSGTDGVHSKRTSKHYVGYGLDLRSRDIPEDNRQECADLISDALGSEFYVAFETNHFHISYDGDNNG